MSDRPCTCHPSERPNPCAKRYALRECWAADTAQHQAAELEARIKDAWDSLLNKDDRNSPADYPEMCLITREELGEYMADAAFVEPPTKMTDQVLIDAWKKHGGAISDDGRAGAWEAELPGVLRAIITAKF